MSFSVLLTKDAEEDLNEIHDFITGHDSPVRAGHVIEQIGKVLESLSENPERGRVPKELSVLCIQEYREVFFKPYRILYRVIGKAVYVFLIADGRRNMQALLMRRLLS